MSACLGLVFIGLTFFLVYTALRRPLHRYLHFSEFAGALAAFLAGRATRRRLLLVLRARKAADPRCAPPLAGPAQARVTSVRVPAPSFPPQKVLAAPRPSAASPVAGWVAGARACEKSRPQVIAEARAQVRTAAERVRLGMMSADEARAQVRFDTLVELAGLAGELARAKERMDRGAASLRQAGIQSPEAPLTEDERWARVAANWKDIR